MRVLSQTLFDEENKNNNVCVYTCEEKQLVFVIDTVFNDTGGKDDIAQEFINVFSDAFKGDMMDAYNEVYQHWTKKKDNKSAIVFCIVHTSKNKYKILSLGDIRAVFKSSKSLTQEISQKKRKRSNFIPKSAGYWLFAVDADGATNDHHVTMHKGNGSVIIKRQRKTRIQYVHVKKSKRGVNVGAVFGFNGMPESNILATVKPSLKVFDGPGTVFVATSGYWMCTDACKRSDASRYVRPITRYIARTIHNFDNPVSLEPIKAIAEYIVSSQEDEVAKNWPTTAIVTIAQ